MPLTQQHRRNHRQHKQANGKRYLARLGAATVSVVVLIWVALSIWSSVQPYPFTKQEKTEATRIFGRLMVQMQALDHQIQCQYSLLEVAEQPAVLQGDEMARWDLIATADATLNYPTQLEFYDPMIQTDWSWLDEIEAPTDFPVDTIRGLYEAPFDMKAVAVPSIVDLTTALSPDNQTYMREEISQPLVTVYQNYLDAYCYQTYLEVQLVLHYFSEESKEEYGEIINALPMYYQYSKEGLLMDGDAAALQEALQGATADLAQCASDMRLQNYGLPLDQ